MSVFANENSIKSVLSHINEVKSTEQKNKVLQDFATEIANAVNDAKR